MTSGMKSREWVVQVCVALCLSAYLSVSTSTSLSAKASSLYIHKMIRGQKIAESSLRAVNEW